jgi:hypothetical protein
VAALHDIFAKRRLTPGQLRSVADRRYDDAMCLLESAENARATGAIYMGGFVIECLLKALLLERHPNLQQPVDPARLSKRDREVLEQLYGHELDVMLQFLPDVKRKLTRVADEQGRPLWRRFRGVCEEWTVYARYSTKLAAPDDAREFMGTVREVKEWLKEP